MANHSCARFKRPIEAEVIKSRFEAINGEYFANLLRFTFYENNSGLEGCSFELSEKSELSATIWITRNNRAFEWRHSLEPFMWWIMNSVMSRFIVAIDPKVKITDDGIDKKLDPDFHIKYPKPIDWLIAIPAHYCDEIKLAELKQEFERVYAAFLPKIWSAVNS